MYPDLQSLLQTRIDIIADHALRDRDPDAQLRALQDVSEKITLWHSEHRSEIVANLNHFLTGCSYSKALDYLKGSPRQPCS